MEQIKHACCHYACQKLQELPKTFKVIISGSEVPGEGELKIMQQLIENEKLLEKREHKCSHVIVSDDSDLILLGMSQEGFTHTQP